MVGSLCFDHVFSVGVVALYIVASVLIALFPVVSKAWYTHVSANHCIEGDQQHGQTEIGLNPAYDEDNMHQVEISFGQKLPQSSRAKAEAKHAEVEALRAEADRVKTEAEIPESTEHQSESQNQQPIRDSVIALEQAGLSPGGLSDIALHAKVLSKYTSVNHALQSDTLAPQQEATLKRVPVKQLFLREHAEPLCSEFISPRKPAVANKQAKDDEVTASASSRSPRNSSPTRPSYRSGTLQPKEATRSKRKKTKNSSQLNPNSTLDKIKRTRKAGQKRSISKKINTDAKSVVVQQG